MNLLFRISSWWKKLASFMTLTYFQIWASSDVLLVSNFRNIIVVLMGLILGAVITSFINNYYDIDCDKQANKQNFFVKLPKYQVYTYLTLALICLIIFFMSIGLSANALIFYVLAIISVWLYSSSWVRFKEKPGFDLFFDGVGTQLFPALFGLSIIAKELSFEKWDSVFYGCLWLFLSNGVRALIIHQYRDKDKDEAVGLRTFVNSFSALKLKICKMVFLFFEVLFLILYLSGFGCFVCWIVLGCFLFFTLVLVLKNKGIPYTFFSIPSKREQRIFLYDIYFILPLFALILLGTRDLNYFFVLFAHILLFHYPLILAVFSRISK